MWYVAGETVTSKDLETFKKQDQKKGLELIKNYKSAQKRNKKL